MNKQQRFKRAAGFTLVELLVTIVIVIVIVGATVPTIFSIRNSMVISNGVNTVKAGITSARVYSLKKQNFMQELGNNNIRGQYSGTAIVFTPANEMHIMVNDEYARDSSETYLETMTFTFGAVDIEDAYNGFKDVEGRSAIRIPKECGVVGITRDLGGDLKVLPPPFAIRFDANGYQVVGIADESYKPDKVYCDADGDGKYDLTARDFDDYNVNEWDPHSILYDNENDKAFNPKTKKHRLPFGQLESVLAVIVYNKNDFANEGGDLAGQGTTPDTYKDTSAVDRDDWVKYGSIAEWMQLNGRLMMVSRMTGTLMDEYKEARITR